MGGSVKKGPVATSKVRALRLSSPKMKFPYTRLLCF